MGGKTVKYSRNERLVQSYRKSKKNPNKTVFLLSKDFANIGLLSTLIHQFGGSPSRLLASAYPDYEWLPWKFAKAPGHVLEDNANKRKFLDWAGQQLGVKEFNDWNKVSDKVFNLLM
jgi:hypothetical protein